MEPNPIRPSTPRMPPPPRPDSPTFKRLVSLAEQEQQGQLAVPTSPAKVRRATVEEWGAIQSFKSNIDDADRTGNMRKHGEFFQTFTSKPAEMDYVANHPIHFQFGDKVSPPTPAMFPPGTSEMMHSHPPPPPDRDNAFPSAQDYVGTYVINHGNERGIGSLLLDIRSGQAFAFDGHLNPQTNLPEFHRLTPPSLQDTNAWMIRHGHLEPPRP